MRAIGVKLVMAGLLAVAPLGAVVAQISAPVAASGADTVDSDRLHTLTSELRCLVCQNESLADSTAPLALDLKREIRARMAAGDSDGQIRSFLVERYGDFVTYRPPFGARTLLLWLGPLVFVGVGAAVLWRHTQRSAAAEPEEGGRVDAGPPPVDASPAGDGPGAAGSRGRP